MKIEKTAKIIALLLAVVSVGGIMCSCSIPKIEESENATISVEAATENQKLCDKANNTVNAATVKEYCTLEKFNQYNIYYDVFNRITTASYITDVNSSIGLPVLRKIGDSYYSVHPIKADNDKVLYGFIMYNNSGKVIDGWCASKLHTANDYSKLTTDNTKLDVDKIDPYSCFMENISENTATGYHKLSDGKEMVINYSRKDKKNEYYITDLKDKDDSVAFTNKMLKSDLELIK